MPFLSRITATFFTTLITRLGVRPPPPDAFELSNVVQPVSIVDADIALTAAVSEPLYGTPATAGEVAAPAGGTLLADTGVLVAGNFNIRVLLSVFEQLNDTSVLLQHRNAANGANIWEQRLYIDGSISQGTGVIPVDLSFADTFVLNERFRVVLGAAAAGAGSTYFCSIFSVAR